MSVEEVSEFHSKRMKENNPMKNPNIVKKVHEKLKKKRESGELFTPTGRDHWLWSGNRKRSNVIRTRLYRKWGKKIRERDGYKCTKCGASECKLEVHHTNEKYSEILKMFCNKPLDDLTYDEFEKVCKKIVDYHLTKPVEGVTLCVRCHAEVDPQRKIKK